MNGFLGMVPDQVEQLAADLARRSSQVEAIVHAITWRLQQTTWLGPDREAFEAAWSSELSSALGALADALRDTARAARSDAEQQRLAAS